jgi:hypothetical protein
MNLERHITWLANRCRQRTTREEIDMLQGLNLNDATEKAMEQYIETLIQEQKPLLDIQTMVKNKFENDLKAQLGEEGFNTFSLPVNGIRTVHAELCAREKRQFECAGLFED